MALCHLVLLSLVCYVLGEPTIHFVEKFEGELDLQWNTQHTAVRCLTFQTFLPILLLLDQDWESKWVASTSKGSQAGKFKWSAGKFYGDPDKDKGIVGLGLQDYYWSDRFSLL